MILLMKNGSRILRRISPTIVPKRKSTMHMPSIKKTWNFGVRGDKVETGFEVDMDSLLIYANGRTHENWRDKIND